MVMETGSVTQAGKLLYISQPAVSRLIADLEEHVNFQLFDRRKKRLIPTVEAKLLYDEVEKAFIGLSSIEDTAQSILELKRGHLRLIAMPGIAILLLPQVIKDFKAGRVVPQGDAHKLAAAIKEYRLSSDAWFAAHEGAVEAGQIFVPEQSIDAWIERAYNIVSEDKVA